MLVFGFSYCVVTPFLSFRGRFWMAGVMTHVVFFAARDVVRHPLHGRGPRESAAPAITSSS